MIIIIIINMSNVTQHEGDDLIRFTPFTITIHHLCGLLWFSCSLSQCLFQCLFQLIVCFNVCFSSVFVSVSPSVCFSISFCLVLVLRTLLSVLGSFLCSVVINVLKDGSVASSCCCFSCSRSLSAAFTFFLPPENITSI